MSFSQPHIFRIYSLNLDCYVKFQMKKKKKMEGIKEFKNACAQRKENETKRLVHGKIKIQNFITYEAES